MNEYKFISRIYDNVGKNEHKKWTEFIFKLFIKYKVKPKKILDIGCGTGESSIYFLKKGYNVVGLDKESNMLKIAKNKIKRQKLKMKFFKQDMRSLKIPIKFDAVVSLNYVMNYLIKKDFEQVLNRIFFHLNENGIFIFDYLNYKYLLKECDNIEIENFEDFLYFRKGKFEKKTKKGVFDFYLFSKGKNNTYKKYSERHIEYEYKINEIKKIIRKTNFKICDILVNHKGNNLTYFILKKPLKIKN
jgi:ubiquinone/menaquinone biosynthesis C-methylase UbiE